jgi:hypothetical protein
LKYKVTVQVRSMAARKREGCRKAIEAKAPLEEEKWLKVVK